MQRIGVLCIFRNKKKIIFIVIVIVLENKPNTLSPSIWMISPPSRPSKQARLSSDNAMHPAKSLQLLNLNDKCLRIVSRHLCPDDLSAIASSCTRLRCIARDVFVNQPINSHLNIRTQIDRHKSGAETYILRYLRNFGPHLSSIDYDFSDQIHARNWLNCYECLNEPIFNAIIAHCSGSLRSLCLGAIELTPTTVTRGQRLFRHLHRITLKNCSHLSEILPACDDCVDLNIDGLLSHSNLNSMRFEKLRKFTLNCNPFQHFALDHTKVSTALESFLRQHRHLRSLELLTFDHFDLMVIGQLVELVHLCLRGTRILLREHRQLTENPNYFQLSRLRTLELDFKDTNVSEFVSQVTVASMDTLNTLTLIGCLADRQLFAAIVGLRQLRVLKLKHLRGNARRRSSTGAYDDAKFDDDITAVLADCQQLEQLTLHGAHPDSIVHQLGAVWTLRRLKIVGAVVSSELLEHICRFHELRTLKLLQPRRLLANFGEYSDFNINILQNLNQLTDVTLDLNFDTEFHLLNYLGSSRTLQQLTLMYCLADDMLIDGVSRFRALRRLELIAVRGLNDRMLRMVRGMAALRDVAISEDGLSVFTWDGLIGLIVANRALRDIKLKALWHRLPLSVPIYGELLRHCKQQQRMVTVTFYESYDVDVRADTGYSCSSFLHLCQMPLNEFQAVNKDFIPI